MDGPWPALYGGEGGGHGYACIPYTLKIRSGCEGGGKGALIQEDKSATLATNNDQYLFQPMNMVLDDQGGQQITVRTDGRSPTLRAEAHPVYCLQGNGIDRADTAGCNGKGRKEDTSYTLNTIDRPAVVYLANGEEVTGTLCSGSAQRGFSDSQEIFNGGYHVIEEHEPPAVRYIVRRLTPTECARLQGFPDDWGHPDHKEDFTDEEYRFWLDVRNTHAAINGKAVKDYTEEQMLTWYNKLHTDSAEYKMWGNGIALPPALYCLQGMADALGRGEEDDSWML